MLIRVVKKAFGDKPALVITGGDARGVERAVRQVAERLPHVWARGKDRTTIDDVEEDVRTLLGGRSPAGQAAMALYKLDKIAAELAGKELGGPTCWCRREAGRRFAEFVRKEASRRSAPARWRSRSTTATSRTRRNIFTDDFEIASEVDEFWQVLRSRWCRRSEERGGHRRGAAQRTARGARADRAEARAELMKAGAAAATTVRVLSAYKQGYSWLYDAVRPALTGKPVGSITIAFAEIGPPAEWPQQAMYSPTRWLLELFPIDEILARELKIDLKHIRFEKRPIGSPTYEVVVTDPGGVEVLRQTFEPKYVLRSFFDRFPDYEKVRVTTGWITATVAGQAAVDQRIVTDVERFWDHFQAKTLPASTTTSWRITDGKPRREDAPHFGELVVDLTLSEPDYPLGLDKEQIASMEAMHEEIYFNTLHFVDVIGRNSRGEGLDYIGRVIPVVHPKKDGKPGRATDHAVRLRCEPPDRHRRYKERGGGEGEARMDIAKVALTRPTAVAAWVKDGTDGLDRLALRVQVDTERGRATGADQARPGRTGRSADHVGGAGHGGSSRTWGGCGPPVCIATRSPTTISAASTSPPRGSTSRIRRGRGGDAHAQWRARALPRHPHAPAGRLPVHRRQIVQWDTPIPPPEAAEILAKMSTFEEATVYKVGQSYLGKDVWAMDLMPKVAASHWSHAKMTTLKPTIVYRAASTPTRCRPRATC